MLELTKTVEFFARQGQVLDTINAPRLDFNQINEVWFLESGEVDLFLVEMHESKQGLNTHLQNIRGPALLFEFPVATVERPHQVIVATHSNAKVRRIAIGKLLEKIGQDPLFRGEFYPLVADWVARISKFFLPILLDQPTGYLVAGSDAALKANQTAMRRQDAVPEEKERALWIEIVSGDLAIFGKTDAVLSAPLAFPLPSFLWFKALKAAKIHPLSFEEVAAKGDWQKMLLHFHRMVLNYFYMNQKELEERERERLARKRESEAERLDKALRKISSALEVEREVVPDPSEDPLTNACQLIGGFFQIKFNAGATIQNGDDESRLVALCNGSGIRYRRVLLTENWWKRDSGPLLGFFGKERDPVALLNPKSNAYDMVSPFSNKKVPVDGTVAGQLDAEAYTFYRSIPETVSGGLSILLYFVKSNLKELLNVIFLVFIGSVLALFPPFAAQQIFDRVIPSSDLSLLGQVFLGLTIVSVSIAVFYLLRALGVLRLEGIQSNQVQSALWDRLLKLQTGFFRKYRVGELIKRVYAIDDIRVLLSGNAIRVVLSGLFSFVYLFIMLYFSSSLTLLVLGVSAISLGICFYCLMKAGALNKEIFALQGATNGALLQIILGVPKLRITGAEGRAFSYWGGLFSSSKRLELQVQKVVNIMTVANAMLPALYVLMIFSGVMVFFQHPDDPFTGISVGQFLGFFVAFSAFSLALYDVTATMLRLVAVFPLWELAKPIWQERIEAPTNKIHPGNLTGSLRIDNVTFRYAPTTPLVLKGVSINANPGEFIALVGSSGSGKSSIVRLLLGFENPESGGVYYDGQDLERLDINSVRQQLGVVLQDDKILSGTLLDNITCGRNFTNDQIQRALDLSGFSQLMDEFPMGLHTMLSSGGDTLSGGQRQRLFIARALAASPKILIFDEATSALDNKSQDDVSKSIEMLNVTRVVIAHRLSTIRKADRIYVLEKGVVTAFGTFQELSSRPGLFADMLRRQEL